MNSLIVSIGEILWDQLPGGEKFGGAPANFACHAAILGNRVKMVGAVGKDSRGKLAIELLESYGIDTRLVQTKLDAATGTVGVRLDASGKPDYEIHLNAAWDQIEWTAEIEDQVRRADAIIYGTLGQRSATTRSTIRNAITTAKHAGTLRFVDINLRSPFYDSALIRESIQSANILKLSDEELPEVCSACKQSVDHSEAMIRSVLDWGKLDAVVMTQGAQGAVLVTANETLYEEGVVTDVVDTVGAGDAFAAAFVTGFIADISPNACLRNACAVAAATCAHAGAIPQNTSDQ